MDDDFSTLIDELSSFEFPLQSQKTTDSSELKEEDVAQYFLNKTKALIESGVSAIQDMTPYVVQSQDPKEIAALAELMSATTQALDTLNKTTLVDKKANRDEELEHIRIQGRKELAEMSEKTKSITNQLNVVVTSREEIMNKLFPKNEQQFVLEDK